MLKECRQEFKLLKIGDFSIVACLVRVGPTLAKDKGPTSYFIFIS